jgi:hypothetical protein
MPNTNCTICRIDFHDEIDKKIKTSIDVNRIHFQNHIEKLELEMAGVVRYLPLNVFIQEMENELDPDEDYKPVYTEENFTYFHIPTEEYNKLVKMTKEEYHDVTETAQKFLER